MNAMERIRHRRSVRTFDGRPLSEADAARVRAWADGTRNPYGVPIEWRLLSASEAHLSSPVIVGADTYIAGKLRRQPHGEEAFGYAFERLLLQADAAGIGGTWIAGTLDRPAFERAMDLAGDEVMPCVSPLGYPAEKMSIRETLMRKGVRADSRLDFEALFFEGRFGAPLGRERAGALAEPFEMVRWAPSAVNKQPWRAVVDGDAVHFFEKRSKGYVDAGGWDLQKVDMGIALCHFALGLEAIGRTADFVLRDPGLTLPEDTAYIATFMLQ